MPGTPAKNDDGSYSWVIDGKIVVTGRVVGDTSDPFGHRIVESTTASGDPQPTAPAGSRRGRLYSTPLPDHIYGKPSR